MRSVTPGKQCPGCECLARRGERRFKLGAQRWHASCPQKMVAKNRRTKPLSVGSMDKDQGAPVPPLLSPQTPAPVAGVLGQADGHGQCAQRQANGVQHTVQVAAIYPAHLQAPEGQLGTLPAHVLWCSCRPLWSRDMLVTE